MATAVDMAAYSRSLQVEKHEIDTLINMFPPGHMTADRLPVYNDELKEIKDKFREFSTKLFNFAMQYTTITEVPKSLQGESMTIRWWQQVEEALSKKVADHHLQVRQAASQLQAQRGMSDFERRDLEIKEKQLALMEENKKKSEHSEQVRANAIAQSKYDEILTISIELEEYLGQVTDWEKATRAEVITAMKSLDKWSQRYNDLHKAHRDFTVATSSFPLSGETEKVEEIMQDMINKYSDVTAAIQDEDKKRELYSLAGATTEQVKMPKFSGGAGEDFTTFKSKLIIALEKNRIAASDKIDKLRSCLSGQALALVPEKSKDFSTALQVLADAFGNPEKILAVRINELKKLGKCPPESLNGKWNYQAVVSFCLKVEVLVQDLIDLAEADASEQLKYDAYSSAVRVSIQNLFSIKEVKKMRSFAGRGKTGLEEHIKYVKDIRSKAQNMVEPVHEVKEKVVRKSDSKAGDDEQRKASHNIFKKPRRFEDCRICGTLETEGGTDLYDDHISDDITGCPKFQAMSADDRRNTCLKARFCLRCCDNEVVFNAWHSRNCKVSKTQKLPLTCVKYPKCTMHSWLCPQHKDANKSKITEFTKKLNITPPVNTNTASTQKSESVSEVSTNAVKPDEVAKVIKNMRRNAKKKGAEVYDIPQGNSMFILAPLKGKSEPVLTFLDSGCSDAVFKDGIPGDQLQGICVNQGPICCTGVGNIQLQAKQEWIVKFKRKDGNYQLVQGLTLDTVCAPMPIVALL